MEKKEAMKILKDFYDKSALFSVRTALDTVIPELKENGDEEIRKAVIYGMHALKGQHKTCFASIPIDNVIAWLEKQGKQKPTSDIKYKVSASGSLSIVNDKPSDYEHATITQKDFASVGETATIELSSPIDCGDRIYHVSHKPIEENGEQNQEWSGEDDAYKELAICAVANFYDDENPLQKCIVNWLKSLKDKIKEK